MRINNLLLAGLAAFSSPEHVKLGGLDSCKFNSMSTLYDAPAKIKYVCGRVGGMAPQCVELDLTKCVGNKDGQLSIMT